MGEPLAERERIELFESTVLPYLDAAYNLARWLTRDPVEAEDLAQEGVLRALTYFDSFRSGDGRAWLLAIVRNAFYTSAKRRQAMGKHEPLDEEVISASGLSDSETLLQQRLDAAELGPAIEALPVPFREVIVLREIEGLSYREIATVAGIPIGTVMSRLARARGLLRRCLTAGIGKEA